MKKYFIVSDVHSYYNELLLALSDAGFNIDNPEHILISCGDAFDRGPESLNMINLLLGLYNKDRAILIKGNHEDLMEEAICRHFFKGHDIHNGTNITVCDLTGIEDSDEALQAMRSNDLWNQYINACIDFYESKNYIFVHGWIPVSYKYAEDKVYDSLPEYFRPSERVYNPDWRDSFIFDWQDARWFNGMRLWAEDIREPNKTIVCGHYHTSWGHANLHDDGREFLEEFETYYIDPATGKQEPHANFDIFYDEGIIAIDACTALTKKVNCLVLTEEEL